MFLFRVFIIVLYLFVNGFQKPEPAEGGAAALGPDGEVRSDIEE